MATDDPRRGAGAAAPQGPPAPSARPRRPGGLLIAALRGAGAGLLIATAAIHLDLYVTGYRSIPVIGPLFLLQIIAAFLLGGAVLVTGSRLAAAAGALFALSTLGGYLLSIWVGLFGFTEVRTTAGIAAGVVEVAAFAALAALAGLTAGSWAPGWLTAGVAAAATAVAAAVALVLLGVAVAGAGPKAVPSADGTLRTATENGVTVLTNGQGFTLYWFAPDRPSRSVCSGTCAQYWPPVTGRPTAAPAIAARVGTITRSDGSTQATYDRHPLYTYVGDSAPGQANGNNLNLNGGLWHEVTVPA
ncbi:MAG TPA: hypothetical protein VHZ33_01305 [Trebonia sp.]|nr:hypothetical protein [Trebonia sp.]